MRKSRVISPGFKPDMKTKVEDNECLLDILDKALIFHKLIGISPWKKPSSHDKHSKIDWKPINILHALFCSVFLSVCYKKLAIFPNFFVFLNLLLINVSNLIWMLRCEQFFEIANEIIELKRSVSWLPEYSKLKYKRALSLKARSYIFILSLAVVILSYRRHPSLMAIYTLYAPSLQALLIYVYLCEELSVTYNIVNDSLVYLCHDGYKLEKLRLVHGRISETSENLTKYFGIFHFLNAAISISTIFVCFWINMIIHKTFMLESVVFILRIYVFSHTFITATENLLIASRNILVQARGIHLHLLNKSCQDQMNSIILQVEALPLRVSVSGYFDIRRHVLLSVFSGLVTYFTVMVQYSPFL